MLDHYLCAKCRQTFAVTQAIDGYQQGYKTGFLCPHCNANLQEVGESDDVFHLRYGISYLALIALLGWLVDTSELSFNLTSSELGNSVLDFLIVLLVPTCVFVYINRGLLFSPRTVFTRVVR